MCLSLHGEMGKKVERCGREERKEEKGMQQNDIITSIKCYCYYTYTCNF